MNNNATVSRTRRLLVSLYLPFFLLLSLPLNIFLGNMGDIAYPLSDLGNLWLRVFIPVVAVLLGLCFVPGKRFQQVYFGALVGLSLIAWVESSFLFGDYGMFNGEVLDIDNRSARAVIEALICIALLVVLIFRHSLARILGDLVIGILVLTVISDIYHVVTGYASNPWRELMSSASIESLDENGFDRMSQFSKNGNVVHILLDELQSDVFAKTIEQDKALATELTGFTWFTDTAAVFPYTEMSLPAILSGAIYDNSYDMSEYLERHMRNNDFLASLKQTGYQLDLHIHTAYCNDHHLQQCTGVPGISMRPAALNLIDLALFRSVPDILKPTVHNNGGGRVQASLSSNDYLSTQTGIGFILLKRFVDDFDTVDGPPRYKFFQSLITHAPQVLNADCSLSANNNPQQMVFMVQQTRCAFREVTTLLDKMRSAGIYDSSVIVISSDHGGNYLDATKRKALLERDVKPKHFARSKATLLLKRAGATQAFSRSSTLAQLSDIPRTLSQLVQLDFDGPGEDLFSSADLSGRTRYFSFIEWKLGAKKSNRLAGYTPYRIQGDIDEPSSWEKIAQ